ncbi:MAG TPA: hypothetical protein VNU68_07155 [Verrucomicrobiae bacterium]|nr:hypothetical protein [Verrucomicrobiae bacterium]
MMLNLIPLIPITVLGFAYGWPLCAHRRLKAELPALRRDAARVNKKIDVVFVGGPNDGLRTTVFLWSDALVIPVVKTPIKAHWIAEFATAEPNHAMFGEATYERHVEYRFKPETEKEIAC